jgi:hypothetical protein
VRSFLAYLSQKLIMPTFQTLRNYKLMKKLQVLLEITTLVQFLYEKESNLRYLVEEGEYTQAVQVITSCAAIVEKYPQIRQLDAMQGTIFRLANAQMHLHSELMLSLINLSNNYSDKRLENIILAFCNFIQRFF